NVDFVDIYYIFDKPDINFEYQFNCSEYGFENIIEFDVNLDIMETVGDLNINFWNFETSQWDNINQIPSSGFYSYNIDSSADDYFDNDELFILGFEQNDYWDGRPYTNYKIKIDFIQIKIPPPDPPPNLIAYQTPFQICLRWDDSYTYGAPVLYYNIYKNESEGGEMKLIATSSNTEFNDSEVEVGIIYYGISAYSHMGESNTSNIEFMFQDIADPVWNPEPEDQTIELGDPFIYEVNADDLSEVYYSINDTIHFAINSGTGLITNAIVLSVGKYWLEITAEDPYGHAISTVIKITVEDTINPEWNPDPEDQTIELGDPFNYEVNADDLSGVIYSINDTTHFAINSGTGLITNAITLSVGEYWLEITAEDPYGHAITTVIKITVEDTTDPVWNPDPEDQTIELGDPFNYEVNADDLSGVIYSINDTTHFAINSGTGLITNAIALSVGEYWLEITAEDPYGNVISATIKITVEKSTSQPPAISGFEILIISICIIITWISILVYDKKKLKI
ncbi:MAG: cadherin repeat domain-containing protein, partial [Promethearchaeota archaeon]